MEILIQHADVIRTAPEVNAVRDCDIAIQGSHILAIQPGGSIDPAQAETLIDARGMVAMPGLINGHAHTAMVLFRGIAEDVAIEDWFNNYIWPVESNLNAEDVYWGALLGIAEMIEAGVTTVADHYFQLESIAAAIEESGMRANLAYTMFGSDEAQSKLELATAEAFIERWQGGADGRITAWFGPHSPYLCSELFLRQVVERAHVLGVGVHIHVSETHGQVEQSLARTGFTPVEYLHRLGVLTVPVIAAHAAHATPNDIQILAGEGAGVIHCPKTFLRLASGIAPLTAMKDAGVRLGFGSDGAASNSTLDILEQARLASMLQKHQTGDATAFSVADTLQMATLGAAHAIQNTDGVGDLAPGMLADLILIRQDGAHMHPTSNLLANVLYSAHAGDVDTTIVNGRVLMHNRQLLTLDKGKIFQEVTTRIARLHKRIPSKRIQTWQT